MVEKGENREKRKQEIYRGNGRVGRHGRGE